MSEPSEKMATVTLTLRELKALVISAKFGIQSGKMLTALSEPEDDIAMVSGLVKLESELKKHEGK